MKSMKNVWTRPLLAMYEGDEGGDAGGDAGAAAAAAAAAAADQNKGGNKGNAPRVFTQEDVNKFLADDRRKHAERYSSLEKSYTDALADQNLSKQAREELEQRLETIQAQSRTKEQNLELELNKTREKFKKEFESTAQERDSWKTRYESAEINRALSDAAQAGRAIRNNQVVTLLRGHTKMTEVLDVNGKPTGEYAPRIHMETVDPKTKERVMSVFTADEAIAWMKEQKEEYGNLFESEVSGGLGGRNTTAGASAGKNGKVDLSSLTPAEFRKLRKENPDILYRS